MIKIFKMEKNQNLHCHILFNKYFNDDSLKEYTKYRIKLSNKKVYANSMEKYCEMNNYFLNVVNKKRPELTNSFLKKYLFLTKKLIKGNIPIVKDKYISFADLVIDNLFDFEIIDIIYKKINSMKDINCFESELLSNKEYPEATTFNKTHYSVFHTVTALIRLILPICIEYLCRCQFLVNKEVIIDLFSYSIKKLFYTLSQYMKQFYRLDLDLYNKFYNYIYSLSTKTNFTMNSMWKRLSVAGKTQNHIVDKIVKELISSLVPKFTFDKNIISLITVSTENTVFVHTFKKKDDFKINVISSELTNTNNKNQDDNNSANSSELVSSYNYFRNEDMRVMSGNVFIEHTINIIANNYQIVLDKKFKTFENKIFKEINISNYHLIMISMVFHKYFNTPTILYSLSKQKIVVLLCILNIILSREHFKLMNRIVISKVERFDYFKIPKKIINNLNSDFRYKKLLDVHYSNVSGKFEFRNPVENFIINIISNVYKEIIIKKDVVQLKKIDDIYFINDSLNFLLYYCEKI